MKKKNYLIMAVSATAFAVAWLFLLNVFSAYELIHTVDNFITIMVLVLAAVFITIMASVGYLKQKENPAGRKVARVVVTALIMIAFTIAMFYLAIAVALSFWH
jgi:hypothetical protein